MAGSVTENVAKLSFAIERMQAAEGAYNFIVDFCLQTTSTVVEVSRCRHRFDLRRPDSCTGRWRRWDVEQSPLTVVDIDRSLWASTTLAVESPTDLLVASHGLERSSSRFSVTLLVFSRADHSTSQVLTTFYVVFISTFYWRLASKAPKFIRPLSDWSTAVTSYTAVNSDARSIQISSRNIRIRR